MTAGDVFCVVLVVGMILGFTLLAFWLVNDELDRRDRVERYEPEWMRREREQREDRQRRCRAGGFEP